MEKIDYRKMGMEIKIRRLRADISQSDLAKQIGVSQSHLCNVENGRLSPSLRLLLSLRKLLGCTIDELLIGTDTESTGFLCLSKLSKGSNYFLSISLSGTPILASTFSPLATFTAASRPCWPISSGC